MKHFLFNRNLIICFTCATIASIFLYFISESYITRQAEKNIQNLLLSHKGIHHYVQKRLLPALYEYKEQDKLPKEFYAPELFSSSFITRNQHKYYNQELTNSGFPQLYYKLAANNPRNPTNKADALEKELIEKFNQDRSVKKYRNIVEIDDKKYLYFAIPFLKNEKQCMVCHGRREDAPAELQEKYPGEGGFNEKIGEIRAITSIRAPLDEEYHSLYIIVPSLVVGIFTLGFLMLFNNQLRSKVNQSTKSLTAEVSEKQKIATELLESQNYLKSIQNAMQVGLLLINHKTHEIVDVNKAALELIDFPREKVVGEKCFSFLCPSQQSDCPIVVKNQTLDKSERVLMDSHGKEIPVIKTATRIKHNGQDYILETFIDITEQKEIEAAKVHLENRLTQAQKMEAIGTLAGGIAHDFNNILAAILGYTEMAIDDSPAESIITKDLNQVLKAGHRAKGLVQQILAFSRQENIECLPLQTANILKEVIKMLRPSLPSTIEITQKIATPIGLIFADPTQINQIVMNLCTNAFHAMEETGGTLDISLKEIDLTGEDLVHRSNIEAGTFVQLSICDSGSGIAPEIKDKIFNPYFTTKNTGKGTGMGLSIVHGVVQSYGGFITLYSEPGEGTAVHVFLPVADKEISSETETINLVPVGNERILFIDDEEILAQMGKDMLERLGYQVTVRNNSLLALETFQNQPDQFDIIITDQTMPGMPGIDLARRILQIRPNMPIILCTGYSSTISEEKAKLMGIREFALKPLSKRDIAKLIRKVLGAS
jgi:PAS domain S-box-containing protein